MRRSFIALTILALFAFAGAVHSPTAAAQSPVIIGPAEALGFDYLDAALTAYAVTDFQVAWDSTTTFVTVGIPPVSAVSAGITTYKVVPSFSSGTHTFQVRVCNAVGCSVGAPATPFAFALLASPGVAPTNVRKVAR